MVSHSKEVVDFSQESTLSFLILTTTGHHPEVTMPSWPPEHHLPIHLSSRQEDRSTGLRDRAPRVSEVAEALVTLRHALLGRPAATRTAARPAQPAAPLRAQGQLQRRNKRQGFLLGNFRRRPFNRK